MLQQDFCDYGGKMVYQHIIQQRKDSIQEKKRKLHSREPTEPDVPA